MCKRTVKKIIYRNVLDEDQSQEVAGNEKEDEFWFDLFDFIKLILSDK